MRFLSSSDSERPFLGLVAKTFLIQRKLTVDRLLVTAFLLDFCFNIVNALSESLFKFVARFDFGGNHRLNNTKVAFFLGEQMFESSS